MYNHCISYYLNLIFLALCDGEDDTPYVNKLMDDYHYDYYAGVH